MAKWVGPGSWPIVIGCLPLGMLYCLSRDTGVTLNVIACAQRCHAAAWAPSTNHAHAGPNSSAQTLLLIQPWPMRLCIPLLSHAKRFVSADHAVFLRHRTANFQPRRSVLPWPRRIHHALPSIASRCHISTLPRRELLPPRRLRDPHRASRACGPFSRMLCARISPV